MKDKYIIIENDGEPFSRSKVHHFDSEASRDTKFDELKEKMTVNSFLYKGVITAVAYAKPSVEIVES